MIVSKPENKVDSLYHIVYIQAYTSKRPTGILPPSNAFTKSSYAYIHFATYFGHASLLQTTKEFGKMSLCKFGVYI